MCAKLSQVLAKIVPDGAVKDAFTGSYYSLYYNLKHGSDNGFRMYYKGGRFEFAFDNGVRFTAHENMADELKRSLRGYLGKYDLKRGDTVVDCGAYIGEFTLYASKAVGPEGKVIAFEPEPALYKKLEANIALNDAKNVILVNKGVWSGEGALKFIGNDKDGYSFMVADKADGTVSLPVTTLDAALRHIGVTKVDFIKIDVEGAEMEVIKGAAKTLAGSHAHLAIASYHLVDGKKTFLALEKMLPAIGYRAETSHPRHLTTYGWKE